MRDWGKEGSRDRYGTSTERTVAPAHARCRIPGELRRCPLKLRGLSPKPCADPTRVLLTGLVGFSHACFPHRHAPPIPPHLCGSAQGFGDFLQDRRRVSGIIRAARAEQRPFSHLQLAHFTWNPTPGVTERGASARPGTRPSSIHLQEPTHAGVPAPRQPVDAPPRPAPMAGRVLHCHRQPAPRDGARAAPARP